MSRWLDLARASPPAAEQDGGGNFGTNGTIGTGGRDRKERRNPEPIGTNGTIGTASPISLDGLRALFDLTLDRTGGDMGVTLATVRASLRNDPRLAPERLEGGGCQVCHQGDLPGGANVLLPFLAAASGAHVWLHEDCHAEYVRGQNKKVDAYLRAAGLRP